MDEEFSSEDRVKREIERLRQTVGHAVDLDQSSDEDTLQVDSGNSEYDVDQVHFNDCQYKHPLSTAGSLFTDTAMAGISQDSLASFSGIDPDLSASPEVCLAMNRAYQQMIGLSLVNITTVLELNRQRQEDVRLEYQATDKSGTGKRKTLTKYSKPFFKDSSGSYPPPNNDTLSKRHAAILDPFLKPPRAWSVDDRDKLRKAVQTDRLKVNLRPCMNRKELEHAKLKAVVSNSDEEKAIKDRLDLINAEIKLIRSQTDIKTVYGELSDSDINSIDWLKISNVDFEGLKTPESCKQFWKNAAHPGVTTSKWLPEEDTMLVELAIKYKGVCWEEVARELGTHRTAFQCLQRYQTKLNPCLQTGKWTPEEDSFLHEVVTHICDISKPIPWSDVAYYVEGRSREQCAQRWEQLNPIDITKGKWTKEEDKKLSEAVMRFGLNWWKIQEFVSSRSGTQCRERWSNTLDQKINFNAWTYEEDKTLWLAVEELGEGKWARIVEVLPGRTDNMCLQRYRRLQKWQAGIAADPFDADLHPGNSSSADLQVPLNVQRDQQQKARLEKELELVEREARQRKVERALLKLDIDIGQSHVREQVAESLNEFGASKHLGVAEVNDVNLEDASKEEDTDETYAHNKQVNKLKVRYRHNPTLLQRHLDELEMIRDDRKNGILIPRGPRSEFSNPSFFDPVSQQQKMKTILQKHFCHFVADDKVNMKTKIDEVIANCNAKNENVTVANVSEASLPNVQRRGRKRIQLSFEEVEVENNIMSVLRKERRKCGRRRLTADTSTNSSNNNDNDEVRQKVMRMMTTALNFHKFYVVPPSTGLNINNGNTNTQLHYLDLQGRPVSEQIRRAMQGEMARKLYVMPLLPPSNTTLGTFKRLLLDKLRLMTVAGPYCQDSLFGMSEVVKQELNNLMCQRLQARREYRLSQQRKRKAEQKPRRMFGVLQQSRERAALAAAKKACNTSESSSAGPSIPSTSAKCSLQISASSATGDADLSSSDVRGHKVHIDVRTGKLSSVQPFVKRRGPNKPKGLIPSLTEAVIANGNAASEAEAAAAATAASFAVAMTKKPPRAGRSLVVIRPVSDTFQALSGTSRVEADDLMNSCRNTHDYQMLKARFTSLFVWPALLSTLPLNECTQPPLNDVSTESVVRLINLKSTHNENLSSSVEPRDDVFRVVKIEKPCKYPKMKAAQIRRHQLRAQLEAAGVVVKHVRIAKTRPAIRRKYRTRKHGTGLEIQRRSTRLEYKRLLLGHTETGEDEGSDNSLEEKKTHCGHRRRRRGSKQVCAEENRSAQDCNIGGAVESVDTVDECVDTKIPLSELIVNDDSAAAMPPPALPLPPAIPHSPGAGTVVQKPAGVLMVPLYSTISADGSTSELTLGAGNSPLVVVPPNALQGLFDQMPWLASGMMSAGGAAGAGGVSMTLPLGTGVNHQSAVMSGMAVGEPQFSGYKSVSSDLSIVGSPSLASCDQVNGTQDTGANGGLS